MKNTLQLDIVRGPLEEVFFLVVAQLCQKSSHSKFELSILLNQKISHEEDLYIELWKMTLTKIDLSFLNLSS